ncbi:hypothetical protein [Dokdonia sp. Hel_I_53]|uniref:hypothetical protein n=1 Tax=Dokdonia sp. Hel_I_53 TaxID=1566287 RepID=UPI00119AA7A2|nr:hypothetical protein [Dokdonia sp. Hel_I_53]TVZ52880.1 hypothetical protein OD90_2066 [Dokdonia sp. Hel_I_53]
MKNFFLTIIVLSCTVLANAQTETYKVDGVSYDLGKEVEGTLTLLWNTIDRDYRYFALKDGIVMELVNTRIDDKYQEEYKKTLAELTTDASIDTAKINLTLGSLRTFFNTYNLLKDASYVANSFMTDPEYRLGIFGGITNNIFTTNPKNSKNPQGGVAFEILDPLSLPRHAIVFQVEQTFATNDFDYKRSQFSLNYRFKFLKLKAIDVFINTKLVTFTSFDRGAYFDSNDPVSETIIFENSGSSFQAPTIFGLGADIRIGKGFLNVHYRDAFAIFIEDNEQFPIDLSIGYTFIL